MRRRRPPVDLDSTRLLTCRAERFHNGAYTDLLVVHLERRYLLVPADWQRSHKLLEHDVATVPAIEDGGHDTW